MTLIERLEQCAEPSRELDAEIYWLLHGSGRPPIHDFNSETPYLDYYRYRSQSQYDPAPYPDIPAFTSSIDDAVKLIPDGFSHGYKMLPQYKAEAECGTHTALGKTAAIALTIAALKAREPSK